MLRRLSAIEIAEGALLADIAVIFQLIARYLPVGKIFFALLVPIVFAVLVLRRGFYTGMMGLCVALFIISMLTGLNSLVPLLFEVGAGLFLGVTMKYRLHYVPLILLGVTGSATGLYCLTLLTILLLGKPFADILVRSLRNGYVALFSLLGFLAPQVGLGNWWTHTAYPVARHIADLTLTYWLVLLFVSYWIFLAPVVIIVYYTTTYFVRLLGYDVRPFPGGKINKLIQWLLRRILNLALKLGLGKQWITRTLIKEVRRQSIRIGRQKSNL